ncbi:hypothetical protein ACOCEA_04895 [Maribacter sp. CXY002]|uniref:hypothetical protein n=1 Tax=Maribacter luteocoastalis TaxID=3407671 RepID=UPI003B67AA3F
MKFRLGIIAIVLFGMNLVSCSPISLAEENQLYDIQATEGDDGEVEGGRGKQ